MWGTSWVRVCVCILFSGPHVYANCCTLYVGALQCELLHGAGKSHSPYLHGPGPLDTFDLWTLFSRSWTPCTIDRTCCATMNGSEGKERCQRKVFFSGPINPTIIIYLSGFRVSFFIQFVCSCHQHSNKHTRASTNRIPIILMAAIRSSVFEREKILNPKTNGY